MSSVSLISVERAEVFIGEAISASARLTLIDVIELVSKKIDEYIYGNTIVHTRETTYEDFSFMHRLGKVNFVVSPIPNLSTITSMKVKNYNGNLTDLDISTISYNSAYIYYPFVSEIEYILNITGGYNLDNVPSGIVDVCVMLLKNFMRKKQDIKVEGGNAGISFNTTFIDITEEMRKRLSIYRLVNI